MRLLEESVADDCIYTDPSTDERHGRAELIATIQKNQAAFPGVSFRNDQMTDYDGQAMFEWTMYGASGPELVECVSYARFGADGRLTNMSGFFVAPGDSTTERPSPPTGSSVSWDVYQASWARMSSGQRRTLLTTSMDEEGVYSDPGGVRRGREEVIAYVDGFQERYSGDWFRQTVFIEHHGQAISRWERVPADGSAPSPGASYARFNSSNRLIQMSGFPGSAPRES